MSLLRQMLAAVLTISLAPGGMAFAQSAPADADAKPQIQFPGVLRTPAPIADSVKAQVLKFVPAHGVTARRNQGNPPPAVQANAAGFATGATVGGLIGFGVAGHYCHCESGTGFLVGAAIGGVAGLWLVHRLRHP